MKVIVTGASGFFGPGIVARLREAAHDVVPAARGLEPPFRLDITDPKGCHAFMKAHHDADAVVHAAALAHVPAGEAAIAQCEAVNVEGTRNVARAAVEAGIERLVFISSITVYGDFDLPHPVTEAAAPVSVSMYGSAKRRAEEILASLFPASNLWVLRMSTMYAPEWLFNVRKRVSPPLVGRFVYFTLDPNGRRYTLCSRRNGAEAVLWAVERRLPAGIYNVSEYHVYSQGEILRAVEHVEGAKPHVPVPVALPRAAAALASVMPRRWRDNARSRYWKFCEHNVYSSARLATHGLRLRPHLLDIGRG